VAERGANGAAQLRTIVAQPPAATSTAGDKRGVAGAAYALPADAAPSALAFGAVITSLRRPTVCSWPPRGTHGCCDCDSILGRRGPDGAERLLQDVVDVVRSVATAVLRGDQCGL